MPSLIFRLMLAWVCRSERLHGAPKLPCHIGFTPFHRGLIMQSALDDVGLISDSELVCRLEGLVNADRALSAKLLVHLGEVEVRGLHLERSFSSMFDYCRSGLGMSEAEAHLRILAARVGRYGRAFMQEKLREARERRSKLQALVPDTCRQALSLSRSRAQSDVSKAVRARETSCGSASRATPSPPSSLTKRGPFGSAADELSSSPSATTRL